MVGLVVVLVLLGSMVTYLWLSSRFRRDIDRLYDVPEDMLRSGEKPPRPFNPGPNTWFPQN